jgi:signal transduction histidine kinase
LATFGSGIFVILQDQLETSFDSRLITNAEHAAGAFLEDVDASGALRPPGRLVTQLASTGGRLLVLDRGGRVIADSESTGAPSIPITPDDLAAADAHAHAIRDVVLGGADVHVVVEPISEEGAVFGYVVWADSTQPTRDLLATVGTALVVGGAFLVAIAFAGGMMLAKRALAPVAEVTDTARAIELSGDFGARVEQGSSGDEVADLGLAFNEMLAALEQNHLALQRFLADASHQLRTPLTSIRANLDLAQRPDLPADELKPIIADAKDEADRVGRLVRDLLSLARAESGARLDFSRVELDALVIDSVRRARRIAGPVRVSVSSVEPAVAYGDRDRLSELLDILLDNAVQYTPAGGSVSARLDIDNRRALITVEDTGVGFDEQDRERLFERLYRGARARQLRPAGTGLGLAIARWIVDMHGGTIEVANRVGGGTVVTLTLPLLEV